MVPDCDTSSSLGVKYGDTELNMGSITSHFGQLCGKEQKGGELLT